MKVAVSIPVHEAPQVVVDQVRNIVASSPQTCVVLHVSAGAAGLKDRLLVDLAAELQSGAALINSKSIATNLHNVLAPHLENFAFLEQARHPFETFCFEASNDLLIRPGLSEHVTRFDYGLQHRTFQLASNVWHAPQVREDEYLRAILRRLSGPTDVFHGSQIEGAFFRRELLVEPFRFIREAYPDFSRYEYPKEEVLLPTVVERMHDLSRLRGVRPYVFVPWGRRPTLWKMLTTRKRRDYSVVPGDVDQLLAGIHPSCDECENVYGVKRVDRRIDDPVRVYIRGRMAAGRAAGGKT